MRKVILAGLMAATVVPSAAVAAPRDHVVRREEARMRHEERRDVRRHSRGWTSYSAPVRDWRYRPVTIGYRLQPSFYGSRYYVTDYNMYRLRAPSHNQRWVRYGDDLLLVNVRTGRVLEVIHNRYW